MKILGIIPARSGSKGVPFKNVRMLAGEPLISYTVEAALNSQRLSDVVLSTDSAEFADIAKSLGVWVPFLRPENLAQDDTPAAPVAAHVLDELEANYSKKYDIVVWLQPTSPFRKSGDIDAGVDLLISSGVDSVVSVYQVEDNHPSRMYAVENGMLKKIWMENAQNLRQKNDVVYHRNGAIYVFWKNTLAKHVNFFGNKTLPYIMSKACSINIDDEMDFQIANFFMQAIKDEQMPIAGMYR